MPATPKPGSREWWETKLDEIAKVGCYPPALMEVPDLFDAPSLSNVGAARAQAIQATALVETAVRKLGDPETNPRVRAAIRWLGLDPATRGLPLKDRRRAAAATIQIDGADGVRSIAVATWRRNYEPDLRRDLGWLLAHG